VFIVITTLIVLAPILLFFRLYVLNNPEAVRQRCPALYRFKNPHALFVNG
jgi:hypothetical protein